MNVGAGGGGLDVVVLAFVPNGLNTGGGFDDVLLASARNEWNAGCGLELVLGFAPKGFDGVGDDLAGPGDGDGADEFSVNGDGVGAFGESVCNLLSGVANGLNTAGGLRVVLLVFASKGFAGAGNDLAGLGDGADEFSVKGDGVGAFGGSV